MNNKIMNENNNNKYYFKWLFNEKKIFLLSKIFYFEKKLRKLIKNAHTFQNKWIV